MTDAGKQALTKDELQTLERLLAKLSGPGGDLPPPLFRFITEVTATATATANVDLLVRDEDKGMLFAWRDDAFGTGWHIPGSIIRHREEIRHRITACAQEELGCDVDAADRPVALIQIFDDRGHSVSICYPATLRGPLGKRVSSGNNAPEAGDLRWFPAPPTPLYPSHLVYRDVLNALEHGQLGGGVRLFTQRVGARDAAQESSAGMIDGDTDLA